MVPSARPGGWCPLRAQPPIEPAGGARICVRAICGGVCNVWLYAEKYERVTVFYMLRSRSLALLHSHRFFITIQSFRWYGELSNFQSPKLKSLSNKG